MYKLSLIPIIIVIIVAVLVAFVWYDKSADTEQIINGYYMDTVNVLPLHPRFSTTSATMDQTADWKTYSDEKIGYSFKYPATWKLYKTTTTNGKNIDLINLDTGIKFSIVKDGSTYKGPYTISISYDDGSQYKNIMQNNAVHREVMNGYNLSRFSSVPSQFENEYSFFEKKGDGFIILSLSPYSKSKNYPNQEQPYLTYNQILSTFKFTK